MNNKLDEINRGVFRYQLPELQLSDEIIELSIGAGDNYTGRFIISNLEGKSFKGVVYSSHEMVSIKEASFSGIINEIEYEFDSREAVAGDCIKGNIVVVSDCGEIQIPFCFSILQNVFESSIGSIGDLNGFTKLAQKDFQEALIMFNSPQFDKVLLNGDVKNGLLYKSLIRGNSKSIALEEFLVAARKKPTVLFKFDKDRYTFDSVREDTKGKLIIKKNTWGFFDYNIRSDNEFVAFEKNKITEEDFSKDKCELFFNIISDKLVSGQNKTIVHFESIVGEYPIEIVCSCVKGVPKEKKEQNEKTYKAQLLNNYLEFRNGKTSIEQYLSKSEIIVQNLCIIDDNGLNELYRIHLYIMSGQKARAVQMLDELEKKLDEKDRVSVIERCGYLYLKTLVTDDDIVIKIAINTITNFYEGENRIWQILWILLYINKKYDTNPSMKLKDIREQLEQGCNSPMMYYEACGIYNKEPVLLNNLSVFEIRVINWGTKNDCISEDLSLAFASLAVRIKEFDVVVFKILSKLYSKYSQTEVLMAICSLLIKGEKYEHKYFDWYKKGVEEQLKITYLYEGYMYSFDESRNEHLPESLLIYFNYNSNLSDTKKAYLYSSVIRNKARSPQTYESYAVQIKNFMIKQLKDHIINENMKLIYEDMLTEDILDEDIARELPYIMFRYDVSCYNPNYKGVVVVHKVLSLEQYANFSDGKTQVNIFADGTEIFLVDVFGNRYADKNSYTVKKLLNCEKLAKKCFELNPTDGMMIVHLGDEIDNYVREDFDGKRIKKKLVDVPHLREEYKRKYLYELIQYTFENGETDLLDHYLGIIDIGKMQPNQRSYLIEYLIIRGFRTRALDAINAYGFYKIPVERLVKLATKSIDVLEEEDKETILKICEYTFFNGKYDENILNYLIDNYNGSTRQMYDIWKAAYEFQLETTALEERLLAQMLFAESYVPDVVEIFRSYYRNYSNINVVRAFLMYNAYKYVVKDRVLGEAIFDIIKKELVYQDIDMYAMALLKYYSSKSQLSEKEIEFVKKKINYFSMKGIVLPFFKSFGDKIQLPEYIADKHYVSYIADPNMEISIHYSLEDDKSRNKFIEEKMKDSFYGIRVKEFILFFGDNLQYYIVEKNEEEENITESLNICISECSSDEESRYSKINLMLMTREMNDEVTLIEAMKGLAVTDFIAANIFEPL